MRSLFMIVTVSLLSLSEGKLANLVLLNDAPARYSAMCLDGSPPGYFFREGYGSGAAKWIIHLEGGGWCYNEDECVQRSKTYLGSSKSWVSTFEFALGFLSDSPVLNPDFYNWNLAFVNYCDGASFVGNVIQPVIHNGTTLYFRGFPILQATLDSLMEKGMKDAQEVILTGCSAGGIATYVHADYVASVLPQSVKFRAMADAGFFLNEPTVDGVMDIEEKTKYVFKMQNCSGGLSQKCIAAYAPKDEAYKCIMTPHAEPFTSTLLFALNSEYDAWSLANILKLPCTPPACPPQYMKAFENYRQEFLDAASGMMSRDSRGYFFDACIIHCQSLTTAWNTIMVNGQNAATTFGNWYFNRTGVTKEVDCPYPCNKSC